MKAIFIILGIVIIISMIGLTILSNTAEKETVISKCYDDNGHEMIGIECKYDNISNFDFFIAVSFLFIMCISMLIMLITLAIIIGELE